MEPRALINMNGSLTDADAPRSRKSSGEHKAVRQSTSPTQTATPQRAPLGERHIIAATPTQGDEDDNSSTASIPFQQMSTPTGFVPAMSTETPGGSGSPTTPYYLSQGAKLVQQTCPPKQTGRGGLFPVTGRIEDVEDVGVRARLEAARRKSLVWKPRVGSPLSWGGGQ